MKRAAVVFTTVFAFVLLWAFLTPVAQLPAGPDVSDYVWHIVIFAIFVIPISTTMPNYCIKMAVFAVLYGSIIEFMQPYFGRGFETHDLISNIMGVGAGWFISRPLAYPLK